MSKNRCSTKLLTDPPFQAHLAFLTAFRSRSFTLSRILDFPLLRLQRSRHDSQTRFRPATGCRSRRPCLPSPRSSRTSGNRAIERRVSVTRHRTSSRLPQQSPLFRRPRWEDGHPGRVYLAYAPGDATISVDLSKAQVPLEVTWIDTATGRVHSKRARAKAARVELTPPARRDWAVAIQARWG